MSQKRSPSHSSSGSESGSSDGGQEEQQQQQAVVVEVASSEGHSDSPPKAAAKLPPRRRSSRRPGLPIKSDNRSRPMEDASKYEKAASRVTGGRKHKERTEGGEEAAVKEEARKKPFQRVWTEQDEIAVLKGMIRAKRRGEEPESSVDHILKSVSKSLHLEFTRTQMADKMRRLKSKYEANRRRSERGADPSFFKPHDQAVFELSKKIWGRDVTRHHGSDDMEVDRKPGKKVRRKSEASYPKLKAAVTLMEEEEAARKSLVGSLYEALHLLEPEVAQVLEERWRKHFVRGVKYFWERSKLKEALLKLLLEALDDAHV